MGCYLAQYMYMRRFLPERESTIALFCRYAHKSTFFISKYPNNKLHLYGCSPESSQFWLSIYKINKTILVLDGFHKDSLFSSIRCRIIIDYDPPQKEIDGLQLFDTKYKLKGLARLYLGVKDDLRLTKIYQILDQENLTLT